MLLSEENISLQKYFQREIDRLHNDLKEIKSLISERNLRMFQIEEMMRELEVRVHDNETWRRLAGRAIAAAWVVLSAIAIAYLIRVLGL